MHKSVVCFIVGLLGAAGILGVLWTPGILFHRWHEGYWPWDKHFDQINNMGGTLVLGIIIVGGTWLLGIIFTALGCKILGVN